jgi:hypothetical protein
MRSLEDPTCGTAGCFAGLISIVANDIPEFFKNNLAFSSVSNAKK